MDFKTLFKLNNYNVHLKKINTTEAERIFNEFKGKLTQKFATLTSDELIFAERKKTKCLATLKKLGKTKDELFKAVAELKDK